MSDLPEWTIWPLALAICALFLWFFWHTAVSLLSYFRSLLALIQNWPQIRRAMVEGEARSGGRYPFWFRAVRVSLILAMMGLLALVLWRRFT